MIFFSSSGKGSKPCGVSWTKSYSGRKQEQVRPMDPLVSTDYILDRIWVCLGFGVSGSGHGIHGDSNNPSRLKGLGFRVRKSRVEGLLWGSQQLGVMLGSWKMTWKQLFRV